MLTFLTSLRHPHNSADYSRVEALLQQTLQSVTAQRDRDFRVVVVGNKEPGFELPAQVEFVPVDFDPPSSIKGVGVGRDAILHDKGTKLAVGLLAARHHDSSHFMVVDADDFVSNRIAELVSADPASPGWVVSSGYIYSVGTHLVKPVDRFNERCGTSLVLPLSGFTTPDLPLTASQDDLYAGFGEFTVRNLLGSHRSAAAHFAAAGAPLRPVPFPAAVYRVGTGENAMGKEMPAFGHPVTSAMQKEFGLPSSLLEPRALLETALGAGRALGRRAKVRLAR